MGKIQVANQKQFSRCFSSAVQIASFTLLKSLINISYLDSHFLPLMSDYNTDSSNPPLNNVDFEAFAFLKIPAPFPPPPLSTHLSSPLAIVTLAHTHAPVILSVMIPPRSTWIRAASCARGGEVASRLYRVVSQLQHYRPLSCSISLILTRGLVPACDTPSPYSPEVFIMSILARDTGRANVTGYRTAS